MSVSALLIFLLVMITPGKTWQLVNYASCITVFLLSKEGLPKEAVDIFEPLGDEVVRDWLCVIGESQILQSVEEQRWTVVKCGNGHLQAHRPQLTGLHFPCQTLQCSSHKQGHNL